MGRHSHFEIAGMIGAPVNPLAKNPQPPAHRRIFTGKTRTAADVREIENEIVDRITFILERGGNRETFAAMEKGKDNSAARRRSVRSTQDQAGARHRRASW